MISTLLSLSIFLVLEQRVRLYTKLLYTSKYRFAIQADLICMSIGDGCICASLTVVLAAVDSFKAVTRRSLLVCSTCSV